MKKFLVGAVGLVALGMAAPASAADLGARPYTKAPPPMVQAIYDWSGFYVGINGGGGSAHKSWDFIDPATGLLIPEGSHNATGGTVGGQIGYRWQATNWVFGLEAQGNWANFRGTNISLSQFSALTGTFDNNRSRINSFGLFTGQIGYAWNNVLFYVKGGGAVVGDRYDIFDVPTGLLLASARETRWGGTVGAGLEYGFAPNWSVGVEYDHLFMGHRDVLFTDGFADRISQNVDMGLVRVNYRWGGPAVGGWGVGGPGVAHY